MIKRCLSGGFSSTAPIRFMLLAVLCANVFSPVQAGTDKLPALGADIKKTSVSGLSSGAFMASQFYVVFSSNMLGAGIIAGGPYLCAQSWAFNTWVVNATSTCMNPLVKSVAPNTPLLVEKAKALAKSGDIDSLDNLKSGRVYLFSGKSDHVVSTVVVDQTAEFFKSTGVPATAIKYDKRVDAGHAIITNNSEDSACNVTDAPFVNDCNFEQSTQIINHIFNNTKQPAETLSSQVVAFDQSEFAPANSSMSKTAYVYVPAACKTTGKSCPVHVVFHGCLQGAKVIGDKYYNKTGYNEIAEANSLIMLYPQVEPSYSSPVNPQGCWDFWGYSSPGEATPDYYTRNAPQLRAVFNMVKRLAEPKL